MLSNAVVYIYDFLLTIAQEKQHFWRRRFSYISALFFINRYVVLLNRLVRLVNLIHWRGNLTGEPDNVSNSERSHAYALIPHRREATFVLREEYALTRTSQLPCYLQVE